MKNIFLMLVFAAWLVPLAAQKKRFFNPDYRDCIRLGVEKYQINEGQFYDYDEFAIALHYGHDLFRLKNTFLRASTGIDCFIDWGFHLQTGLAVGARLGFLEFSAGPTLHAGDFFREANNPTSSFLAPTGKQDFFKTSLNASASVTIAKILFLGIDWQRARAKSLGFSPSGGARRPHDFWVNSHALRLGFWF